MDIESILRTIIREELERVLKSQPVEEVGTGTFFEQEDEPSMTTAELLQNLIELIGGNSDKKEMASELLNLHFGYSRVSMVPDAEARTVWNTLVGSLK